MGCVHLRCEPAEFIIRLPRSVLWAKEGAPREWTLYCLKLKRKPLYILQLLNPPSPHYSVQTTRRVVSSLLITRESVLVFIPNYIINSELLIPNSAPHFEVSLLLLLR